MLSTRGGSRFLMILEITNNTRILVRTTCIVLYFIHGPPVFSILGGDDGLPRYDHGGAGRAAPGKCGTPAQYKRVPEYLSRYGIR